MNSYKPVSCDLHEGLEVAAMHRRRVSIEYLDPQGTTLQVRAVIDDVFAKEGAEYLRLDSGVVIRLDALIAVDGAHFGKRSA